MTSLMKNNVRKQVKEIDRDTSIFNRLRKNYYSVPVEQWMEMKKLDVNPTLT